MRGKSVCLSVCLSAPCSAFPVARSRTPTRAFEYSGLRYVPYLAPICPHQQPEGAGVELPGLLSPLILQARQLSAPCSASWWKTHAHYSNSNVNNTVVTTWYILRLEFN